MEEIADVGAEEEAEAGVDVDKGGARLWAMSSCKDGFRPRGSDSEGWFRGSAAGNAWRTSSKDWRAGAGAECTSSKAFSILSEVTGGITISSSAEPSAFTISELSPSS